jgi:hypothetical protein
VAQTDTYANLLLLIEALYGSSFGSTELTRIQALVNRRAWFAYRESDFWEDQLVIGEERCVDGSIQTVPYTGVVFDNTVGVFDINPYTASVDHFIRVHQTNPWNQLSAIEFEHSGDSTGARLAGYKPVYGLSRTPGAAGNVSGTVSVSTTAGTAWDVYVGGTIRLSGFDTDVMDINGTQTVTSIAVVATGTTARFTHSNTASNTWTISGDETVEVPVAFCTYKKRLNSITYGASDTTAIPQAWFEYIAHGVMADLLRGDERWEAASVEENQANFALQRELERLERMQAPQMVGQRIATHGTEQGRTSSTYS